MSVLAEDLVALLALPAPHGTLTQHLLREIARLLIAGDVEYGARVHGSSH
jgi:hypothetical protein